MTIDGLKRQLAKIGFAHLPSLRPDESCAAIAEQIGKLISPANLSVIQQLVPKQRESAAPNTYSGIYGLGEFPLHTDLAHWPNPPHYLMLRCIDGSAVVDTNLLDGITLLASVGENILCRSLVIPRRPRSGKIHLLRLFKPLDGEFGLLRWDANFLKPASSIGLQGMRLLSEALETMLPNPIKLSKRGDTLIIDNWRMLHGRSAVPNHSSTRKIERAYLGEVN